ncbi:hypothetical protein EV186_103376 [Labedaea rhizosphaerae]|uniref:Uncharacterized protein n=1 Tax=Labedaea rhizosphaerae TaxID=598644 RepID=A0A4R6SBR9_LABRH|nr:hypothetical protein EV186_103376 [Labedaea rhizosphaerae]
MIAVPPPAELASAPDIFEAGEVDLSGLDDVDWAELKHARGSAEDVPELIRTLGRDDDRWSDALDELLADRLLHEGNCYSATVPAMEFIVRLLASGTLPVQRRLDLYLWLLHATGQWAVSMVEDAELAVAESRPAQFAPWSPHVHLAIADHIVPLLDRWSVEPPVTQFFLACLAAQHRLDGQLLAPEVSALAAATAGTQHGAYLRLAEAVLTSDDTPALAIAQEIVGWAGLDPRGLDASVVTPMLRALSVLAAGAVRV